MGFLMGALTMLVSNFVTGSVGPWIPSQMFAAGWIGMSAPLCLQLTRLFRGQGKVTEVVILAVFGAIWGLLFGMIMNLWSWPYIAGPMDQSWVPGTGLANAVKNYSLYYLVTSLVWDIGRSLGNFLLLVALAAPVLRAFRRFKMRFGFRYQPEVEGQLSPQTEGFK